LGRSSPQHRRAAPPRCIEQFVGPLSLACASCAQSTIVFDPAIHGYECEIGEESSLLRGEGDPAEFHCPHCTSAAFSVITRFEYPDDLLEEENEEFRGREQDLFTWFDLIGRCTNCRAIVEITDVECA